MPVNKKISFSVLCAFLTIGAVMFVHNFITPMQMLEELPYSEFKTLLAAGNVAEVTVTRQSLLGKLKPEEGSKEPKLFTTVRVEDPDLVKELNVHNVKFTGMIESTFLRDIMWWVIPALIFGGIWFFVIRRLGQGLGQGQKGFMTVGKSKAKIYAEKDTKVTFADVAGVDEAKEELREVIDFLKTPEKFTRLGGKIPKGILLVGPPGTGKTLLARAVAGEAGVTFFSISGSEFVEMFVGVGASRVRDLFEQAKIKAPCIIFIDELDALGKARGAGPMAHEEREQTLNQLLVEMDGFDPRIAVILMAATNRPEILDPALLRPGRFDRQVLVDRPDKIGRLAILRVHAKQVTLGPDADLEMIAAMTPGFSGADLAREQRRPRVVRRRAELDDGRGHVSWPSAPGAPAAPRPDAASRRRPPRPASSSSFASVRCGLSNTSVDRWLSPFDTLQQRREPLHRAVAAIRRNDAPSLIPSLALQEQLSASTRHAARRSRMSIFHFDIGAPSIAP